jgi:hypothetical protein
LGVYPQETKNLNGRRNGMHRIRFRVHIPCTILTVVFTILTVSACGPAAVIIMDTQYSDLVDHEITNSRECSSKLPDSAGRIDHIARNEEVSLDTQIRSALEKHSVRAVFLTPLMLYDRDIHVTYSEFSKTGDPPNTVS